MASTYSSNLKIELIGVGEQTDAWGSTTNNNFQYALEEGITGYAQATFPSDADYNWAASYVNSNTSQAQRNLVIEVLGTLSVTRNLIVPTIEKQYIIYNATTGGQSILVKTSAGTGVTVPNGVRAHVFVDGTNVVTMVNYVPSMTIGSLSLTNALPVASGGTGATTSTGTGSVVLATSPALTTPNLGTPSAATLTNATGLPLTTGVTGTLAVGNGGTGATTLTGYVKGNGTSAFTASASIPNSDTTATSSNTNSTIVARDASGNFSATTITAALSGNATSATNIAGGAANRIPYNTGAAATSFITAPTTASTYLQWDGSAFAWAAGGGSGSPGGSNTQIQFNDSGSFGGSANLTWDNINNVLTVHGIAIKRGGGAIDTNVAIGNGSFTSNTSGQQIISIGYTAVQKNTSGNSNIGIGYLALQENQTGSDNTAVGGNAAKFNTSSENTAIGSRAFLYGTGGQNTAVGYGALETASGSGTGNVAVGHASGSSITTGANNVFVGKDSGNSVSSGSNNVVIGYNAAPTSGSTSNQITLGNSSITSFRIPGLTITAGAKYINVGSSTVAALPAAATAGLGARAFVTDANATTFAAIVAGGGANNVPVYSDGTNWRIG